MKADAGTCLAAIFIVILIIAFYISLLPLKPKLNSDISNGIKVYILLVANTTRFEDYYSPPMGLKTVEWTERINEVFSGDDPDSRNIDQFFFDNSKLHVQVYMDSTNAIYGNEHTLPDSVLPIYLTSITSTQKQIFMSCNIVWILFSNQISWLNGSDLQACTWGCNAEDFFWQGIDSQKLVIAHEMCHWLGATDKYCFPYYDPNDPDNSVDIMAFGGWNSELILGRRTLQEIVLFTHNWTILPSGF